MADGTIKIAIEVDGKQVEVASKELDRLEESGHKSGKGVKAAESSMDSLSDSSSRAGKDVKGASDSLDGLGDSGSKAGKDLKGADSAIDGLADSSADASKGVKGTSDSLDGMSDSASDAANSAKKMKDETQGMGEQTEKASNNTKKLAVSIGLIAVAAAAFGVLKSSLDAAITRFDTLATFPKVLQALGVSAEDSERAMQRLGDGIDGLPTTLNDIASNAQRMYTSFNDMDKATDAAIALNNALLGSGSSSAEAQRGTDQYVKALQSGKMDMMMWNTLSQTMDVGLIKIAEGFGYAGKSAKNDLYNALQDGAVTMDDFTDKLIEVGTGTGIMAELAKENSLGLATSIGNLKNAAGRGVANIIESFDKLAQETTGKNIAQNIDGLKNVVNASFKVIGSVIEGASPIVKMFASTIKDTIPVVKALTPVIVGLAAAYAAHTVITKVKGAINASNAVMAIATMSTKTLTLATRAQMAATAVSTGATKADILAKVAQTGSVKLSTLAIGVMTGTISLSTAAQVIGSAASYAFGAAIKFLMGPVGWVVAGIGLLTAGVMAVVKWFKRSTEESKRLNKETEDLGESTDALSDSVDSTSEAYKSNQNEIKSTAKANEQLAKKVDDLSKKENKSASEKAILSSYVDQLNDSVEGLNLTYSEEADALSMSSEELQARVDLMKDQEAGTAAQERLLEISKEQNEVEMKLAETNELREEWNQKLEEGSVKSKEHKTAIAELDEQEQLLNETTKDLGEQQKVTEEQFTSSMEAITAATESGVSNQIIKFEELSESQQATVESMKSTWQDYQESATDMFDRLSEKSEISVGKMTKNLEENQRIITKWSENIATLAERGVDEGLLNTLREAGPESAGHVNALVKASDAELTKLSDAFAKGGDVATDALSTSLGIEKSGVMEAVGHLVTDTGESMKEEIKNADFKSIGGAITDGAADGIKTGTKDVSDASKDMAKETQDATKQALDINSPSGVYKGFGGDITDGMTLGISGGTIKVIQAMKKLSQSSINEFKNTTTQFTSIGKNAMSGLNAGLNSGRGAVMATARSIANGVASTMKKALKIHSPSRLMEDDVGKMIPAGITLGIRDGAKDVYRELDNLSNNMIMTSTPEVALGTSRMAYSSGVSQAGALSGANNTKDGSQNNLAGLLKEQNNLLSKILEKNTDLNISGEKVTDIVNEINAIKATVPQFG